MYFFSCRYFLRVDPSVRATQQHSDMIGENVNKNPVLLGRVTIIGTIMSQTGGYNSFEFVLFSLAALPSHGGVWQ